MDRLQYDMVHVRIFEGVALSWKCLLSALMDPKRANCSESVCGVSSLPRSGR